MFSSGVPATVTTASRLVLLWFGWCPEIGICGRLDSHPPSHLGHQPAAGQPAGLATVPR
jgi:hypothetical protein